MRIQHNIAALNSHRQLGSNNSAVSKNLEKLSSGYRINRAGDDAAGLAISEKMRAQITGLNTASKNAQDGISLVQTAEGALTEVHSMLNRMVELAGQSANGTYDDTVDRNNLQKELDSLTTEIDRISKGTNFNGINLLDGNLGGPALESYMGTKTVEGSIGNKSNDPVTANAAVDTVTGANGAAATKAEIVIDLDALALKGGAAAEKGTLTIGTGAGAGKIEFGIPATNAMTATNVADAITAVGSVSIEGVDFKITNTGGKLTLTADKEGKLDMTKFTGLTGKVTVTNDATVTAAGSDVIATGKITSTNGADATKATLKFDVAGMSFGAPDAGATKDKGYIEIAGQKIELDIKGAMDEKAIAEALKGKTITVDGQEFVGAIDTAGGTALTFTARKAAATTGVATAATAGSLAVTSKGTTTGQVTAVTGKASTFEMDFTKRSASNLIGSSLKIGDDTFKFVEAGSDAANDANAISIAKDATASQIADAVKAKVAVDGYSSSSADGKIKFTEVADKVNTDNNNVFSGKAAPKVAFSDIGLSLQIGDTSDSFNQLSVSINSMSAESLGINGKAINISTQTDAKAAVQVIKDAINTVSSTRGDLGAIQNRLDHTINNLGVTAENMTAAESRIRDVDMAQEMMNFTKNNILTQASQSMLAQANQLPQGVLQLLQ